MIDMARRRSTELHPHSGEQAHAETKVHKVRASLYNFGSPKVGNGIFVKYFNKLVPDSFRVVVDGDPVTSVPPGYTHVGTEILVDDCGAGSIIIDPSFVERWLRIKYKTNVASHMLVLYKECIVGVIEAAQFLDKFAQVLAYSGDAADQFAQRVDVDTVKLALRARTLLKEERKRAATTVTRGSINSASAIAGAVTNAEIASNNVSVAEAAVNSLENDSSSALEEGSIAEAKTEEQRYAAEYAQRNAAGWLEPDSPPKSSPRLFSTKTLFPPTTKSTSNNQPSRVMSSSSARGAGGGSSRAASSSSAQGIGRSPSDVSDSAL
jgi:hypothetical protein